MDLTSPSNSSLATTTRSSKKRPRQRRDVLSEEKYTSTLSNIIQRDYYSDLPDLQRQLAVLERRAEGDVPGAVQVRRAARRLQQHEGFLEDLEREQEADLEDDGLRRAPRPLHRETVTGFHARVTSEDNNEFDVTQRQAIQEHRKRLEDAFRPNHEIKRLKQTAENDNNGIGDNEDDWDRLASAEYDAPLNRLDFKQWKQPEARSSLFFVHTPSDQSTNEDKPLLLTNGNDPQQNNTQSAHDTEMRALMPPPRPKEAKNQQRALVNTSCVDNPPKHALVEYIPKHSMEKRIEPAQTRFSKPQQLVNSLVPRRSSLDSASEYSTDASTDLDSDSYAGRPIHVERAKRAKQKQRELESFVNMTPVVIPGKGRHEVEASPIVTWGTVAGTPLLIRRLDDGGAAEPSRNREAVEIPDNRQQSSFSFADEGAREKAAQKALAALEERKQKAQNSNHSTASSSGRSRSRRRDTNRTTTPLNNRDLASFSPAAMSLLAKTSSKVLSGRAPSSARSAGALGSALRAASQMRKSQNRSGAGRASSSSRDHAYHQATPQIIATNRSKGGGSKESSKSCGPQKGTKGITDGLLQLH